ncbi:MAG: NnrS family protein [Chloroflexi bacterium]|nr:NnrS family protein [Chloroflexota bacterium]
MRLPKLSFRRKDGSTAPKRSPEPGPPRSPGNPGQWRALGPLVGSVVFGMLLAVGLGWMLGWPGPLTGVLAVGLGALMGTIWLLAYWRWYHAYVRLLLPLSADWLDWIWMHFLRRLLWDSLVQRLADLAYPKTLFLRFGRVEGGLARARQENARPGPGLVIIDQASAAVFYAHDSRDFRIFGPGIVLLRPGWRIVATIDLRPHQVHVGGDAWMRRGNPPDPEQITLVTIGRDARISARLTAEYVLDDHTFYIDAPELPAWAKFMGITAHDWKKADEEQRAKWRKEWEAGRFLTWFHGHRKAAERLSRAVITEAMGITSEDDLLAALDRRDDEHLPELLSATQVVQELLAQAWREEVGNFGMDVHALFQRHEAFLDEEGNPMLGWEEIERAIYHRLTRRVYLPAGALAREDVKTDASLDYGMLQERGIRVTRVRIEAIYLEREVERLHIDSVYHPLWVELTEIERYLYSQTMHLYRKQGEDLAYHGVARALYEQFCAHRAGRLALGKYDHPKQAVEFFDRFYTALEEAWERTDLSASEAAEMMKAPLVRLRRNLQRLRHFWEENG